MLRAERIGKLWKFIQLEQEPEIVFERLSKVGEQGIFVSDIADPEGSNQPLSQVFLINHK